jgi:hypothetical protein
MHSLTVPIGPDGPLVDVLIGLAAADARALRNAGRPVPPQVSARALIDPGAEVFCVEPQTLAPLVSNLPPARFVIANAPATGGILPAAEYPIGLTVVHPSGNARANLVVRSLPIVEQPLGRLGYQFLVGRDGLDRYLLIYDGPGKRATLAY